MSSPSTAAAAEPLRSLIRCIPDFPRPGIGFRDITPLLADAEAFGLALHLLAQPYREQPLTAVAGVEARGFIVGAGLARTLGVGFIPLRKPGKLPGPTLSERYALEYGEDQLEVHADALAPGARVLLVDDLLATGGTAEAALRLLQRAGARVGSACFLIELHGLGGRARLEAMGVEVAALLDFSA